MNSAIFTCVLGLFYFVATSQAQLTCRSGLIRNQQAVIFFVPRDCAENQICARIEFSLMSKYDLKRFKRNLQTFFFVFFTTNQKGIQKVSDNNN